MLTLSCQQTDKIQLPVEEDSIEIDRDRDGDGYLASEECDDTNYLINPGATEFCDGLDNNCNGEIDEGVSTPYYLDEDGDGFETPRMH